MKKILSITALALASLLSANAQTSVTGYWHSGDVFYKDIKETPKYIAFCGGTCHEGGYSFGLSSTDVKTKTYQQEPVNWEGELVETDEYYTMMKGNVVKHRIVNGEEVLLFYNGSTLTSILKRFSSKDNSLENEICKDIAESIEGVYINKKSNKKIVFNTNCTVSGIQGVAKFTFGEEFETPQLVLVMGKGNCFRVKRTLDGINLYRTVYNEEYDGYEDTNTLVYSLKKTATTIPGAVGNYPFFSKKLATFGQLSNYSKEQLKYIRNEIFARHGYIFTPGGEMDKYFSTKSWYKALPKTKDVKLSETEQLNVALIKYTEADPNYYGEPFE